MVFTRRRMVFTRRRMVFTCRRMVFTRRRIARHGGFIDIHRTCVLTEATPPARCASGNFAVHSDDLQTKPAKVLTVGDKKCSFAAALTV